jgi:predicted DNA-binding mobile mystery protein A
MNRQEQAAQARRQLDRKIASGDFSRLRARPQGGWVRSIRTALGMSGEALAVRLGVTRAAVSKLEHGEVIGGITIGKLDQIAIALDCTLVYALIPNSTLEDTVRRQARQVAAQQLGYAANAMALEDQAIDDEGQDDYLESRARHLLESADIWSDRRSVGPSRR